MKTYFIDKLKDFKQKVESYQKDIIKAVTEYTSKDIVKLSESLVRLEEAKKQLIKDCVVYCTVAEVLEIADQKSWSGYETLDLLTDVYTIAYAYKYDIKKPITLSERDQLVKRFGSQLKDAKV